MTCDKIVSLKKKNKTKDESLWNSRWCLIRTPPNDPLSIKKTYYYDKIFISHVFIHQCFWDRARPKDSSEVDGIDNLRWEDQQKIKDNIAKISSGATKQWLHSFLPRLKCL